MCGEQVTVAEPIAAEMGSPPRVRGTDLRFQCLAFVGGITPACAGNSQMQSAQTGQRRDHPRVCGEQLE